MKKFILFSFFIFSGFFIQAQVNADSLWNVWNNEKAALTARLEALNILISDVYIKSKPDSALMLSQWQYDLAKKNDLKKYMAKALINEGRVFSGQSNYAEALDRFQQALSLNEETGDEQAMADNLSSIGATLLSKGDLPEARDYLERSLALFEKVNDKKSIGSCLSNIGSIYYYQGDYPKALSYYNRSIKFKEEVGDKKGISSSLNNIGAIYYYLGDYPRALDNYKRAAAIQEEIKDINLAATTTQNIGSIYLELGDYNNAMKHFQMALQVYKRTPNKESVSQVLNGIGEIYMKQGDYIKAMDNLRQSLKIATEINDKQNTIEVLFNLGRLYELLGEYSKSLYYDSLNLALSEEMNNLIYSSQTWVAIGITQYKLGKNQLAISSCKMGLEIADEIKAISVEKDACKCLYDAYKSMGERGKALAYYEQMNALNDSLKATETSDKIQQMAFQKQMLADSIAQAEKERQVQAAYEEELHAKENQRNIFIGSGLFILIITGGLWSRLNYIRKSKARLQIEKDRSENLLLNILPEEIAEELKEKGRAEARDFENVSILFTDFKSFTEASAKLSAQELVGEINACFEAFDNIIEDFGIEKIKTIGDAYMAAGGLPVPTAESIKNTVLAGIEMQEFITQRKIENESQGKPAFDMRVGIHTGPIVAGIVGVKKFQYDIWGDTVNTASRIESNGEVGKVNISKSTYELLKDDPDFTFENRGKIQAKGKGEIAMYFVGKA